MIKKLQNNFTTPEQSKRLLKLGVPADSADCSLLRIITDGGYCVTWKVDARNFIGQICEDYLPCWSVGRLIEIYNTCVDFDLDNGAAIVIFIQDKSPIVQMMEMFEDKVGIMDFLKLEE